MIFPPGSHGGFEHWASLQEPTCLALGWQPTWFMAPCREDRWGVDVSVGARSRWSLGVPGREHKLFHCLVEPLVLVLQFSALNVRPSFQVFYSIL